MRFIKPGNRSAGPKAVTVGASPALSTQLPHLSLFAVELTKISNGFGNAQGQVTSNRIYKVANPAHFWDNEPQSMAEKQNIVIEPATEVDLDELSGMLGELFSQESDFRPDKHKQLRGLRLIFEQPSRGRVFVLRRNGAIVGMINLLFTISTAEGGFVILLEDLVIHKHYQGQGYGNKLLEHAIDFAKKKNFLRITLLTDRPENVAQAFFREHGFVDSSMIPMRLWIAPPQNSEQ